MVKPDPERLLRGYYRARLGSLPKSGIATVGASRGIGRVPTIAFAVAAALALCVAPALAGYGNAHPGYDSGMIDVLGDAGIGEAIRGFFAPLSERAINGK